MGSLAMNAVNLRFKPAHRAVLLHQRDELVAAIRIDVKLVVDPRQMRDQGLLRVVTVHRRQRRVDIEILTRRRRLENALDRVLEHAPVHVECLCFTHDKLILF